jgi:Mrp family chromosome partitioning ATPase
LLDALREHYDHVFVAGPPLTGRSDGASYVSLADRAVFVISGSGVHLEVARRALSLLRQHSQDVVGAVLTQRREAVPALIYRWM